MDMECSLKVLKQRTIFNESGKKENVLQVFCPMLGELTFDGRQADEIIKRIQEAKKPKTTA
jgi:hypothetical protein